MTRYQTVVLPDRPNLIAPDGSEVRVLAVERRGSMAHFRLAPGDVSTAVQHRTVAELWFVTAGAGRMWRRDDEGEDITPLRPATSVSIPVGTAFQFRCDGDRALEIVAATMPPWPGAREAFAVEGPWAPRRYSR